MHALNEHSPIEVTDFGIVIWINDEHSLNKNFPIDATDSDIVICFNFEHLLKT